MRQILGAIFKNPVVKAAVMVALADITALYAKAFAATVSDYIDRLSDKPKQPQVIKATLVN